VRMLRLMLYSSYYILYIHIRPSKPYIVGALSCIWGLLMRVFSGTGNAKYYRSVCQSRTQSNACARARMALALGKWTTGTPKFSGSGCLSACTIDRFHLTSRRPYWCTKTMKWRPYWCTVRELALSYSNISYCFTTPLGPPSRE
jgi:hypothetical protein